MIKNYYKLLNLETGAICVGRHSTTTVTDLHNTYSFLSMF
jgi:hypothetical protein